MPQYGFSESESRDVVAYLEDELSDLSDQVFQKTKTDAQLADTIRRGGAGVGLSSLMPPWGRTLTERQVGEVLLYVRSLKKAAP